MNVLRKQPIAVIRSKMSGSAARLAASAICCEGHAISGDCCLGKHECRQVDAAAADDDVDIGDTFSVCTFKLA
jgi:hypothetical protein